MNSSDTNIKYVMVVRINDNSVLESTTPHRNTTKTMVDEYRRSGEEVIANISRANAYADLRDESETIYGVWYTFCDENLIAYSVLTNINYKKSIAYQFLKELAREIYNENPAFRADPQVVNKLEAQHAIERLAGTYSDMASVDKLTAAQEKVNEVRIAMQDNVQKMIHNIGDAEDLDRKSQNIVQSAQDFRKNAHSLELEMKRRNCRLMAMIICIVIAVLLYILVPIIADASN